MNRKQLLGYLENLRSVIVRMSPSEIIVKEVKEESGFDVKPMLILGLIDYNKYQKRPFQFDGYQLFMECEIIGGEARTGIETSDVNFLISILCQSCQSGV